MTLHGREYAVGVRELHDRLSEHLDHVEEGSRVVVTRRGKPVARLSPVVDDDPLEELVRRGLVRAPASPRGRKRPQVRPKRPVSDLVADQRR